MKKIFLNIMMCVLFVTITVATKGQKDSSGVYMTAVDFTNKKLTYGINCKTENHKIVYIIISKLIKLITRSDKKWSTRF